MINDVASIILWIIVAVFFLHLIEGDAQEWIKSKFSTKQSGDATPASALSQLQQNLAKSAQPQSSGAGVSAADKATALDNLRKWLLGP